MTFFRKINPARAIMGRLFLWFWATFIVTAVLAVWGSRFFFEELQVNTASPQEIQQLERLHNSITSERAMQAPLRAALDRNGRAVRGRAIAVDVKSGRVLAAGGPPLREDDRRDIERIVDQKVPITLNRGALKITGPMLFERDGKRFALFLAKMDLPGENSPPFVLFLCIAIVTTTLLSWLFAKSLTRPILRLQKSARSLSTGNWEVRIDNTEKRQDELGQLGRDFNSMADQLEKMWSGQKRLLADISHELRSPLARLQMALGLAHQQNVDPASLARIEREAERMEALVSQLLELSRAENGVTTFSSYSLSLLFRDIFTDGQFEAANSNKALDIDDIPKLTVLVDQVLLCRAVENVLRNAIRHSTYLTTVEFTVTDTEWSVTICDDGEGLSSEECERVFAPFYRATLARERASGGVGLGLSIAKAAVELHHGAIKAVTREEGGLSVTLSFPRKLENT
ncbi:two-component system sensor histidine kinase CpxA [Alteromonas sp. 76-1]|jgi:two-component system sensor histidine kinase CpxA|uniref:ATP-binding protein n=1 Tax=Alteromonas sp. 76-1 TaxID=2358187 RepID=UPI000FD1736C|nr:ATP-binding protein [Alteromonas sp. 76-1]VEL95500.1 two-component system sensor histidine kinase CpxA [Alteromonas sp. 76-1]